MAAAKASADTMISELKGQLANSNSEAQTAVSTQRAQLDAAQADIKKLNGELESASQKLAVQAKEVLDLKAELNGLKAKTQN